MKRIHQIEQQARYKSEKYNCIEIYEDRTDPEYITEKVFNKGKLIAHNIYEVNKISRL